MLVMALLIGCWAPDHLVSPSPCPYLPAPSSLDQAGLLATDLEVHLQGSFLLPWDLSAFTLSFTLTPAHFAALPPGSPYAARFYLAPQPLLDVDLFLWRLPPDPLAAPPDLLATSALGVATEEVIAANLSLPATYHLVFHQWGAASPATACLPFHLELSLLPRPLLLSRAAAWPCPPDDALPSQFALFAPLSQGLPVDYRSEEDPQRPPLTGFAVLNQLMFSSSSSSSSSSNHSSSSSSNHSSSSTAAAPIRPILPYHFTIPADYSAPWRLALTLRTYFPSAGSLGFLLIPSAFLGPDGALPDFDACLTAGQCVIGQRRYLNTYQLRQLLPPGDYTLWFFDVVHERDPAVMPCLPFSLDLSLQQLRPPAAPCAPLPLWPADLDQPGLTSPLDGALSYWAQLPLDDDPPALSFTVAFPDTLFRVRAFSPQAQLGLSLHQRHPNQQTDTLLLQLPPPDGPTAALFAVLQPGQYRLALQPRLLSNDAVCRFLQPLQLALLPAQLLRPLADCPDDPQLLSDLFPAVVDVAAAPYLNHTRCALAVQRFPDLLVQRQLFFTQPTDFYLRITADFALADLLVSLQRSPPPAAADPGPPQPPLLAVSARRDALVLAAPLQAGPYVLTIRQAVSLANRSLPYTCAAYLFDLKLTPLAPPAAPPPPCLLAPFPPDLAAFPYLGSQLLDRCQVQDTFRLPPFDPASRAARLTTVFQVAVDSSFRLRLDPSPYRLSLFLLSAATAELLAQTDSLPGEPLTFAFLPLPGLSYRLAIDLLAPAPLPLPPPDACAGLPLELVILPVAPGQLGDCAPRLPPPTLLSDLLQEAALSPAFSATGATTSEVYHYDQRNFPAGLDWALPFSVVGHPVLFDAAAFSDFAAVDLTLQLNDHQAKTTRFSASSFNAQRFAAPLLLPPGAYTLSLLDGASLQLPRCVSFSLVAAFANATLTAPTTLPTPLSLQNADALGCGADTLPVTLDSLAYLSPLSGYRTHFASLFHLDPAAPLAHTPFTLLTPSLFRLRLLSPVGLEFSLQILTNMDDGPGDDSDPASAPVVVAAAPFQADPTLFVALPAGAFTLLVTSRGAAGTSLPAFDQCQLFAVQLAISPRATYQDDPLHGWTPSPAAPCPAAAVLPPFQLEWRNSTTHQALAAAAVPAYFGAPERALFFQTSTPVSHLRFVAVTDFLLNDLSFTLVGALPSGRQLREQALMGMDHAFLDLLLPPGDYQLLFHSTAGLVSPPVPCQRFDFTALLDPHPAADPTADPCALLPALPTDTYSDAGRSASFGGPQSATSDVLRLSGSDFLMQPRFHSVAMQFRVAHTRSLVRLALWTASPADDIDVYLYQDASMATLLGYSVSYTNLEHPRWLLDPQEAPYYLLLFFANVRQDLLCPTFHLNFEIQPLPALAPAFRCATAAPPLASLLPTLPFTVVADAPFHLGPQSFSLTASQLDAATDADGWFLYPLPLANRAASAAALSTYVGSFFVVDAFSLRLLDNATGAVLQDSVPIDVAPSQLPPFLPEADGLTWRSALSLVLPPGDYTLLLRQRRPLNDSATPADQALAALLQGDEGCHPLELFIAWQPGVVPNQARFQGVSPAGGTHFDPTQPLSLNLYCSAPIAWPRAGDLAALLAAQPFVWLASDATDAAGLVRYPSYASLNDAHTVLTVMFVSLANDDSFQNHPGPWRLLLNATAFLTTDGAPFLPFDDVFFYTFSSSCNCHGHGHCDALAGGACLCDHPYVGATCEACETGYHLVGATCVPNAVCTANTCNGHGDCQPTDDGMVTCTCETGYAAATLCRTCASGYVLNTTTSSDGAQPICQPLGPPASPCRYPLLPASLDAAAYLGGQGVVHLQDLFYIDVGSHGQIDFTLATPSYFRAAVLPPATVDVDLLLFSAGLSYNTLLASSVASYGQEALFALLPEGVYRLDFRYYTAASTATLACPAMSLELAISPTSLVAQQEDQFHRLHPCPPDDVFPFPSIDDDHHPDNNQTQDDDDDDDDDEIWTLSPEDEFFFPPDRLYALVHTVNTTEPYFFAAWRFQVPPTIGPKVASLAVSLGTRFLTAPLGMLLEAGDRHDHCGPLHQPTHPADCTLASVVEGLHVLEVLLAPGTYTLWLYQFQPAAVPALLPCLPFDLAGALRYVDLPAAALTCPLPLLPTSLNDDLFFDGLHDFHLPATEYLLQASGTLAFTLHDNNTLFSIRLLSDATAAAQLLDWSLSVPDNAGQVDFTGLLSEANLLLADGLPAGHYQLSYQLTTGSAIWLDPAACPSLTVELTLTPLMAVAPAPPPTACASVAAILPSPLPALPYAYQTTQPFNLSLPTAGPFVFPLTSFALPESSSPMVLQAAVDFHFADQIVLVQLLSRNATAHTTTTGLPTTNQNRLAAVLSPGLYQLQLFFPYALPGCLSLDFSLRLDPVATAPQPCTALDALPAAFDALRFQPPPFAFFSSRVAVPLDLSDRTTLLSVDTPALLRVFLHTPDLLLDLVLSDLGEALSPASAATLLASVSTSPTPAVADTPPFTATLLATLLPGRSYQLRFLFRARLSALPCPAFTLQLATGPLAPPPPFGLQCPESGSDNLPASLDDLLAQPTGWYLQQQASGPRSFSLPLDLTQPATLRLALLSPFLTGDLSCRLVQRDQTQVAFFPSLKLADGHLLLTTLDPGAYLLTVTEQSAAALPAAALGCLPFTLHAQLQPLLPLANDTAPTLLLDPTALPFPARLDRLPFLLYDGQLAVQGQFSFPVTRLLFSPLQQDAYLRAVIELDAGQSSSAAPPVLRVLSAAGTVLAQSTPGARPGEALLLTTLTATSDALYLDLSFPPPLPAVVAAGLPTSRAPVAHFSLAITPKAAMALHVASATYPLTCSSSPTPALVLSPSGYASLAHTDLLSSWTKASSTLVLYDIPFLLPESAMLSAQVEYDFPLDQLQLQLLRQDDPAATPTSTFYGTTTDHRSQLNTLISPGRYLLRVQQLGYPAPVHCQAFSLRVYLHSPTTALMSDCASLAIVPFDLNTAAGGGPIAPDGTFSLYGDHFLGLSDDGTFTIAHTLQQPSYYSVFVRPQSAFRGGPSAPMIDLLSAADTLLRPLYAVVNPWPRAAWHTYLLQNGSSLTHLAGLWHPPTPISCPSMVLHLQLQPLPLLFNLFDCNGQLSLLQTAHRQLTLSPLGFGALTFAGAVPLSRLQSPLPFAISFRLTHDAYIISSVSFNSLVSDLDSWVRHATGRSSPSPGSLSLLPNPSTAALPDMTRTQYAATEPTDLNATLSISLSAATFAGALQLLHPDRDLCLPLIWQVSVIPLGTTLPYLSVVSPAAALNLPLRRDFSIDLVFAGLNGTLLAAQDDANVLVPATALELRLAFSLVAPVAPATADARDAAAAALVTLLPDRVLKDPVAGNRWRLTFGADSLFDSLTTTPPAAAPLVFTLHLAPDRLFSAGGLPVLLFTDNTYAFLDPGCHQHGGLNAFGECVCDPGYAGPSCHTCAAGHHLVGGDPLCVPDGAPESCQPLSCWGHGTCTADSHQRVVCQCDPGYQPPYCLACAPGYDAPDPASTECLPVGCQNTTCHGHGTCDDAAGVVACTCQPGYAPPFCRDCAPGFVSEATGGAAPVCVAANPCTDATCHGHGTCTAGDSQPQCACQPGYAGDRCEHCALYYVAVMTAVTDPDAPDDDFSCVPSVPCTPDACSGHGFCDDASGVAQCTCSKPTLSQPACASCVAGYTNYPDCTPAATPRKPCDVPTLPGSLDAAAFMTADGEAHLQGNYYLDPLDRVHEIAFLLNETSLLRAYVEPYFVDIDLYLFEAHADGSLSLIDISLQASTEEDLLVLLDVPTTAAPRHFRLRLVFLYWAAPQLHSLALNALCLSFNFELALSPLRRLQALELAFQAQTDDSCDADALPALPPPLLSAPLHVFTPAAHFLPVDATVAPDDHPHFFWSWTFNVSESFSPPGHYPLLSVELGFRFLPGQVALLLETAPPSSSSSTYPDHCGLGENAARPTRCVAGRNLKNRQLLSAALSPGQYTLWLYEPSPQRSQVVSCLHFDLLIDVSLQPLPNSLFACDYPPLPATLNLPGFASDDYQDDGSLSLSDTFLLPAAHRLTFHVDTPDMLFGLASSLTDLPLAAAGIFELFSLSSSDPQPEAATLVAATPLGTSLALPLAPGAYLLNFTLQRLDASRAAPLDCQPLHLQILLSPAADLAAFRCPATPDLPPFPPLSSPYPTPTRFPFSPFVALASSATASAGALATFSLRTPADAPAFLRVVVAHRFFSPLTLDLSRLPSGPAFASSLSHSGQAVLEAVLPASADPYYVTLRWEPAASLPLPCAPFGFGFSLTPAASADSTLCLAAESLPDSFDSPRFRDFLADDTFSYASSALLLPAQLPAVATAPLSVQRPAVLRLAVDTHALADFTAFLYRFDPTAADHLSDPDEALLVATSQPLPSGQQLLLVQLDGNSSYVVRFSFSAAKGTVPRCATFDLQLALRPADQLSGPSCTAALPPAILPQDGYDSVALGVPLFFPRQRQAAFVHALNFSRPAPFDLHVEVFSDFLLANLALQLVSISSALPSTTLSRTSSPHTASSTLSAMALPAGDYMLTISEPVPFFSDLPGCTPFALTIIFGADTQSLLLSNSRLAVSPYVLPQDLGRLPFLGYAATVAITDDYLLPLSDPTDVFIPLRAVGSLLQFSAIPADPQMDAFLTLSAQQDALTPTVVASSEQHYNFFHGAALVYQTPALPTANYSLRVSLSPRVPQTRAVDHPRRAAAPTGAYGGVSLSMGILPLAVYQNLVATMNDVVGANCVGSRDIDLAVSPDGYALFEQHDLLLSNEAIRHRIRFSIKAPSNLFAQLEFPFPLADLVLALTSESSPEPLVIPHGNEGLLELNTALAPGTYYLDTRKFVVAPNGPACIPFTITLTLNPVLSDSLDAQCASYALVPWDLNTPLGGSAPFGGPLQDDRLNLYGDHFYLRPTAAQTASFRLGLTVNATSLVAVFVQTALHTTNQIFVSLLDQAQTIDPVFAYERQTSANFHVYQPSRPTTQLQIDIRAPAGFQTTTCPTFTLHIQSQSRQLVNQMISCPAVLVAPSLSGLAPLNVSSAGFLDLSLNSMMPLQSQTFRTPLLLPTGVTVSFSASLSFNSLVGFFEMAVVYQTAAGPSRTLLAGLLNAVPNLNAAALDMVTSLTGILSRTSYQLELQITFTPLLPASDVRCVPFDLNIQTFPLYAPRSLFVQSVLPASAHYLSSTAHLELSVLF